MIQVKSTTNFLFTLPVGETVLNFNVLAATESEAAQKLVQWLETACSELRPLIKVPLTN